ncbi:MAG: tRNA (adenosine(37)-N6)-threonylcarbamoyltransferase complex transferase subunit TsaD, partial [Rhodospirillales bacterium]|nr:tRNA (adenosine(37)-N6)-threonylcarbamoyltransferase complex transferase subunit TsaD [Rhodospirillales bacterium]
MILLGIETSCDETSAAIVTDNRAPDARILSNIVFSQIEAHQPYEGVVPEIAARAHLSYTDQVIERALNQAQIEFSELDGIAVAGGPGLIGGVIVGVMSAKAIAAVHKLPFLAVNHLEAHALTARMTAELEFPYLLLLVSGGHCQL